MDSGQLQPVLVEWLDASSDLEETKAVQSLVVVTTVGFLVRESEEVIHLISDISRQEGEEDNWRVRHQIPKGMIRSIKQLEAKDGQA